MNKREGRRYRQTERERKNKERERERETERERERERWRDSVKVCNERKEDGCAVYKPKLNLKKQRWKTTMEHFSKCSFTPNARALLLC